MRRNRHTASWLLFFWTLSSTPLFSQETPPDPDSAQEARRQEEAEDYYRKWLKEDAAYIISPEEKKVFESLTTDEERDQFIEQFWYRRDPDPRTAANEYKEEHYRRIAYANERFASGVPGWRTDRGKTYIRHGPPDEIEPHPSGGSYDRPSWEGGGNTATFPFEIWRYRHIDDIGSDIILEFVDRSYSGEYRLALEPEEKDAFLYVPNLGKTEAELMGLATKAQRPFFDPTNRDYPIFQRFRDRPFERWSLWNRIHHAPKIRFTDLQEIVKVDLSYDEVAFDTRLDFFQLNDKQVLVPITVQIRHRDLTFVNESGVHVARVAVYGILTDMSRKIVNEFDNEMMKSVAPAELDSALLSGSLYQKAVALEKKMRYRLDLVVKDLNSGRIGVRRQAIVVPSMEEKSLAASSLMLTNSYELLEDVPMDSQMFVIGDVRIHPSLDRVFSAGVPIGVYFQAYNAQLDQAALAPSLQVKYQVFQGDRQVVRLVEHGGESIQFFSVRRVVLLKNLPLARLTPGDYRLVVEVVDRLTNQSVSLKEDFTIEAVESLTAAR